MSSGKFNPGFRLKRDWGPQFEEWLLRIMTDLVAAERRGNGKSGGVWVGIECTLILDSVQFVAYAWIMLATELRKDMFQTLEKVSKGEPVMIEYKGVALRLEAVSGKRKLAGAPRRNAIVGDPDLLIGPDPKLQEELDAKWAVEDTKL